MADSSYLKEIVEPFVVNGLSERLGVRLSPQQIMVGPREDGDFTRPNEDWTKPGIKSFIF